MRRVRLMLVLFSLVAAACATAAAAPIEAAPDSCRGRAATLVGTDGNDVLVGTSGPDVVSAGAGDDVIRGLGGWDVICAGDGDDVVRGGSGRDTIEGGDGDDRLFGGGGADRILGGDGDDIVRGGREGDTLQGGAGSDRIFGEGGDDTAQGGRQWDRVDGGPGLDHCSAERMANCGVATAPRCHPDYPERCWSMDASELDVPLVVRETAGVGRTAAPVTSGVPVPEAVGLVDLSRLRLLDASGDPVPAAFTATARWGTGPEDASAPVRWLQVDFQASVGSGGAAVFRLSDSGGPPPALPDLTVTDGAGSVTVDTGELRFVADRGDGSVSLDGTNLLLQATGPDGTRYTATGPASVEVTADTPMRAAVRVEGSLRSTSGSDLLDYTARYWLYAGLPELRLALTVENNTPCPLVDSGQIDCYDIGSAGSVDFDDVSLVIPASLAEYTFAGESATFTGSLDGELVISQDSSGTTGWDTYAPLRDWDGNPLDARPRMQAYVTFRGYRATLDGERIDHGDHAPGAAAAAGPAGGWSVLVPRFWESYPKALRLAPDGIEIGLFPDEFGPGGYAFTLRPGEHVTHEVLLARDGSQSLLGDPLMAAAPAAWYAGSGAAGLLALPGADWPDYEEYLAAQLDPAPTYRPDMNWYSDLPAAIADTEFYGVFDYGDWPIDYEGYGVAPINLKYDANGGAWLQWLRGGDARWFDLAVAANRHLADIDVLHTLHSPRHWSDGIVFGHSYHDEEGFSNPHRNYGGNHPDTMAGVEGMLLTYYLTGWEKAYESAIEVADCIEYRLHNDESLCGYFPDCSGEGYALGWGIHDDGERPAANSLKIAVDAFRATGEGRYLAVARALVDWSDAADQPYIGGAGGGGYLKPWMLGLYLRALGGYLEMADEFGVDAPAARDSYLAYADFLAEDVLIPLDGNRAAMPYLWSFDGDGNDEPSVNDWLLLQADALAYAHRLSGTASYLTWAERLFRAGSRDPWYEGDANTYSSTKETVNAISFGQVFLTEWAEG